MAKKLMTAMKKTNLDKKNHSIIGRRSGVHEAHSIPNRLWFMVGKRLLEREPDSVPAPHTSRSKFPFSYNFLAHDEAEVLVARRQGNIPEIAQEN
jgi:hypothetical protein